MKAIRKINALHASPEQIKNIKTWIWIWMALDS